MEITPVAYIKSDFDEKFGVPRQSGRAENLTAEVVFCKPFRNDDALRELEGFEYLWLIFGFSLLPGQAEFTPLVRPPRLGGNKKVGVFASRSPNRPNRIGLSSVKLLEIKRTEKDGTVLVVGGADLVNGTPVYDVKPYLPFTDSHPDCRCGYAEEQCAHKLQVRFEDGVSEAFPQEKLIALTDCLADDPRPSYQEDGREYGMAFAGYNVKFTVQGNTLTVLSVQKNK